MRQTFILALLSSLLTLHSSFFAQTAKIDSLLAVLKSHKQDTNRVNTLMEFCKEYSYKNDEKALNYGEEGSITVNKGMENV